jgi:hypothetical protein
MPLNSSGQISLGGNVAGESIALELALSATGQISFNDTAVRTLAGIASGQIQMPTNFWGKSNGVPFGEAVYTTPATYSFVVPTGVTQICAVAVGGGSNQNNIPGQSGNGNGNGGALSYSNNMPVTAGETLTVIVGAGAPSAATRTDGGDSSIQRGATVLLRAQGGKLGLFTAGNAANGVGAVRYSGGAGAQFDGGGGGGAAGYAGIGGKGGENSTNLSTAGSGGGGGGGNHSTNQAGGGGGVGLIQQGASGAAGGFGGSGGANQTGGGGGLCGGGGGSHGDNTVGTTGRGTGGNGGVRIIYGGTNKTYPFNSAP